MFTYTEAIPSLMATILQSPEEQVGGQSQYFFVALFFLTYSNISFLGIVFPNLQMVFEQYLKFIEFL